MAEHDTNEILVRGFKALIDEVKKTNSLLETLDKRLFQSNGLSESACKKLDSIEHSAFIAETAVIEIKQKVTKEVDDGK